MIAGTVIGLLGLGCLFCFIGWRFALSIAREGRWQAESRSWPQVPGHVTQSILHVKEEASFGDSYSPQVTVAYQVGARYYECRRLGWEGFISSGRSRVQAEAIMARFPKGKEVAVYYDPERPEHSVLEPPLQRKPFFVPERFFAAAFILAGLVLIGIAIEIAAVDIMQKIATPSIEEAGSSRSNDPAPGGTSRTFMRQPGRVHLEANARRIPLLCPYSYSL